MFAVGELGHERQFASHSFNRAASWVVGRLTHYRGLYEFARYFPSCLQSSGSLILNTTPQPKP